MGDLQGERGRKMLPLEFLCNLYYIIMIEILDQRWLIQSPALFSHPGNQRVGLKGCSNLVITGLGLLASSLHSYVGDLKVIFPERVSENCRIAT